MNKEAVDFSTFSHMGCNIDAVVAVHFASARVVLVES